MRSRPLPATRAARTKSRGHSASAPPRDADLHATAPGRCFVKVTPMDFQGATPGPAPSATSVIGPVSTERPAPPAGTRCVISSAKRLSMAAGKPAAFRVTERPRMPTVWPLTVTAV
jgi:hypothetical protein